MPCKDVILPDPIVGRKGQTVQEILALLEEKHIRTVPILDDDNKLVGLFGYDQIMKGLLPVAVTMEDGLQTLDFLVGAAPGVAKRLRKLYPKLVEDVANTNCHVVYSSTSTWEAVRLITKYGSPIPVIEEKTGDFIGVISEQSLIEDFKKIIQELEYEGAFEDKAEQA
ncbi:MAG: CBS domain-containing protein [Pseudomonadota bacterium]